MEKNKHLFKNWKENDIFAWKIDFNVNEEAIFKQNLNNYKKYNGKYMLFILTNKKEYNNYKKIFRIKITNSSDLPTTYDEINNLEYIQIDARSWVNKFNIIPKEIIIEQYKNPTIFPSKYCAIHSYLVKFIGLNQRKIKDNWIYLGNFELDLPKYEQFIKDKDKNEISLLNIPEYPFEIMRQKILNKKETFTMTNNLNDIIESELSALIPIINIIKNNLIPETTIYNFTLEEWIKIILTIPKTNNPDYFQIDLYEEYIKRKGDLSDIDSEELTNLFLRK